jgi:ribosomal protein L37AE/L43A
MRCLLQQSGNAVLASTIWKCGACFNNLKMRCLLQQSGNAVLASTIWKCGACFNNLERDGKDTNNSLNSALELL